MSLTCQYYGCRQAASTRCTNPRGKMCPRHGCECGNHDAATRRRQPRGSMSAGHLVARNHRKMLAFCVKDVTRACTRRPRLSTQEVAHLILETWWSDEEVVEEGVFLHGFLEGAPVKMLHRAMQRMMRYRMRHAYRRQYLLPRAYRRRPPSGA